MNVDPLLTWTWHHRFTCKCLRASSFTSLPFVNSHVRVACSRPCTPTITTRPWTGWPRIPTIPPTDYGQNVENKNITLTCHTFVLVFLGNMIFYNSIQWMWSCPSTYFTTVNRPGSFTINARTLGPPSQGVPLTIHYIHTYSSKNYERQSLPLNIFTLCMCRQSCIYFAKCDSCNYVKQTLLSQINKSVLNSYSYSTI